MAGNSHKKESPIMFSRKRILRLAEKYGPFVRFFPEGSEGSEDANDDGSKVTDAEASDNKEAEPKVEDSPEFRGLLRDRQADKAALSHVNAENAAFKLEIERRDREAADSQKPKDELSQMTEEEAAQEITRGEFSKTLQATLAAHGKKLVDNVTKILDARETKTKQTNLKKNQAADAQALMKTCTAKTKGLSLDAKTVVDEAIAYLAANDPEYLEFLTNQPNFASRVYKLATGEPLVPSVGQRVTLRRNTLLAKQLDEKGVDTPGGGAPPSEDLSVFEAIMSSGEEMSDEALDKMYET